MAHPAPGADSRKPISLDYPNLDLLRGSDMVSSSIVEKEATEALQLPLAESSGERRIASMPLSALSSTATTTYQTMHWYLLAALAVVHATCHIDSARDGHNSLRSMQLGDIITPALTFCGCDGNFPDTMCEPIRLPHLTLDGCERRTRQTH